MANDLDKIQNSNKSESLEPLQGKAWEAFGIAERAAMANSGMRALREGQVAAFLVAGGQGTRLGHEGPKGTFQIGLPSGKSLFQLQAERILNLGRQAGKPIPWVIMTSADNHEATTSFFTAHKNFGVAEKDLYFFQQDQLPVVDGQGRILLDSMGGISLGPNGNGGCFLGLKKSGTLDALNNRGVKWVFVYSVDNALVKVCDPSFVGFAQASGLPAASKAVSKASPEEKVGVFCLRNARPSVIEYSEMTQEMLGAVDAKNRLLFSSANIAIHLFKLDFLSENADSTLPYHVAHKKIKRITSNGEIDNPTIPNAYKFELFMFDLFPRAPGMAILEVKREEEFAPVKNAAGSDSPASARELILNMHRSWAMNMGLSEVEIGDGKVEISPLISYAGEGIALQSIRMGRNKEGDFLVN